VTTKGRSTVTSPLLPSRPESRRARRFTVVHPPASTTAWEPQPSKIVFGRDPSGPSTVMLRDVQASRSHASVERTRGTEVLRLRDLDSKNGTYLDGRRISEPEYLHSGSVIRIGGTLIVYSELVPQFPFDVTQGPSLALAHTYEIADLAAASDLPVLITGPTGAGKEVLARRIHERSGRSGRFVAINCAAFNRDLLGSELFGHVKGAFSGADSNRQGLFAAADGGTLFLDEIAELPSDQQPVLLRALQEKMIRPVGSDRDMPVNVRVLAATHQDLARLERSGAFREDLSARLSGVTIEIAGLEERREEILPLFRDFLGEGPPLTLEAAEALLLHSWPKNIRELQHAAAGAKLFASRAEEIGLPLLPAAIQQAGQAEGSSDGRPSRETLERLLAENGGNVAGVARDLGFHRAQIYRWLNAYGLDPRQHRG
jgi:DNA-binding NtrC family response regulator